MKTKALNEYIDHTLLKPTASNVDYKKLCEEAKQYGFFSVCVPPTWISSCKEWLLNSNVKVATVVGFPLGYAQTNVKVFEIQEALRSGADEIDFVNNLSWVKSDQFENIQNEFKEIRKASQNKVIKVILETGLLLPEEISKLCKIATLEQIDFVKTSTGFSEVGARLEDVKLMKLNIGPNVKIKASGGVKNTSQALKFIKAGAERLGCSSSVEIVSPTKNLNSPKETSQHDNY
jgi:deoxyribose-phosphate aldolase